jgi:hypothetical protein
MRVLIGGTGASEYVICGGLQDGEFTEGLELPSEEDVQVGKFIRATTAVAYPRGNTVTQVSFTVTKEHADFVTAEAYLLERHAGLPKTGDVMFLAEGAGQRSYKLSDGVLQRTHPLQVGVTTIIRYTFIGGSFTAA